MTDAVRHIVIVGNGIAGVTAARHIRKLSAHRITMISDETLQPYSRTALMYIYMGQLKAQDTWLYEEGFWARNRIDRVRDRVTRIDPPTRTITLASGSEITYDTLILATGSKTVKYGWPGQELAGVGGLYHLQDLDRMSAWTAGVQNAVVVGGGLIGIEMAEMLWSRGIGVTFLVRELNFSDTVLPPEESAMVSREIRRHGIDLRLDTQLTAIEDDGNGRACAVLTDKGERIPCGFVGLATGVTPNIDFLRDAGIDTGMGILVDDHLRSSIDHVYAIGDCAEIRAPRPGRKPIEAVWYTGRMMGQTVARTICGNPMPYDPGIWFNSAKFFSIEYQTYGRIAPVLTPEEKSVYWEHPDGRRSIRINYTASSGAVIGLNLMGVRFRHETCARWIAEGRPIRDVLRDLDEAAFDPEFGPRFGRFVRKTFTDLNDQKITNAL
jgi:NADPH-dependent 2,4-dienoyl-CoA reductase/sulfur reductase-like enzyme